MSEVKPLSDDESTQLDVILALIQDDPEGKITIKARTLCRVVMKMRATGPTTVDDYAYLRDVVVAQAQGLVTAPEECPPDAVRELARLARNHRSEKENWVAALRRVEAKLSAAREALE